MQASGPTPRTVLVAPGAFKGTLSALAAADAIAEAVRQALPDAAIINCPIADGGDGTAEVLAFHEEGDLIPLVIESESGPVEASMAWLPTEIAAVDMASAGGLGSLAEGELDALHATSFAAGNLIAAALQRNPRRLIVGAGGSAFSDGGAGLVSCFGISLLDSTGRQIPPGAAGLRDLDRIDVRFRNDSVFDTEIIVACDVTNPLLGENGTARVFGPQKGASADEVLEIELGLEHYAEIVLRDTGRWIGELPRTGAAGGAAGAMWAFLAAELRDGFELLSEIIGFEGLVSQSDLVIVGEGSLDRQSLMGKAPVAAARVAKRLGVPVWAFAGSVDLSHEALEDEGIVMDADLGELTGEMSLKDPAQSLTSVASFMLQKAFGG